MRADRSEEYKRYINSPEWASMKRRRMEIDGFRCVCCGRSEDHTRRGLQVHHISYARLGHEDPLNDLVTVCGSCHKKIHNYYKRERGGYNVR